MKLHGRWHRLWFKWAETRWLDVQWLTRLLFCTFGCEAIEDHCGKPEHDYCWRCNRPMPHKAERVGVSSDTDERGR